MSKRKVPEHILDILRGLSIEGDLVRIPGQLSREDYVAVDKILKDLGAKWNKSRGGHVFSSDPRARLDEILGSEQFESKTQKFGFFPTPAALADRLVKAADIRPGMTVLEPSAGSGQIVDALLDAGVEKIIAIEVQPELMAQLRKKYLPSPAYDKRPMTLREGDFLKIEPWKTVDRVVMNPPFTKGADAKHVLRAYEWLAPGGKLVAIVSSMADRRSDANSTELAKLVAEHGKETDLPAESFKEHGTSVATKILEITKPLGARQPASKKPRLSKPAPVPSGPADIQTVVRRGVRVLAKTYKGEPMAATYANMSQANRKLQELTAMGVGAHVTASHPFLIVIDSVAGEAIPEQGFPIGATVLVDGVDLAVVKQRHFNGCVNYSFPHYHVDLVNGAENVAVALDKVGVETRPDALVRMNSPKLTIRNMQSMAAGTGAKFLVAIEGQKGELVAQRWARKPPVAEPGQVIVVFDSEGYREAMKANDYRTKVMPVPSVAPPEDMSGPAEELILWAENSGDIYPARQMIEEKLTKALRDGSYDAAEARQAWAPWMLDAARRYTRQFGRTFPPKVIDAAVKQYEAQARDHLSFEAGVEMPKSKRPKTDEPRAAGRIRWTPALERAADRLIEISREEPSDPNTDMKAWERSRTEVYVLALSQELAPEVTSGDHREQLDRIKQVLAEAGLDWKGAIPRLIEERLAAHPPTQAPRSKPRSKLASKPASKRSSKPASKRSSKPASKPRSKPRSKAPDGSGLAELAKDLQSDLRRIFPGLYAVASLINAGTAEQYVQASVARSPRSQGRKLAKDAPRFFIVITQGADGLQGRIREHHKNGFLAAERIIYPDRFSGDAEEVRREINGWLVTNASAIAAGAGDAQRKTNAQVVYEALSRTGPKATTREISSRLETPLPQAVVEKNLETLQRQGMAFAYGPSGALGIHSRVGVLPFWATREQVLQRGLANQGDLPPVTAKWAAASAPAPSPALVTENKPPPKSAALRIDAPTAIAMMTRVEGPGWAARQERDRSTLMDPGGFYTNLAAFQVLADLGPDGKGLVVSDLVPSAGIIQGEAGRMYAVLPDGQIALYADTASDTDAAAAARVMMVV